MGVTKPIVLFRFFPNFSPLSKYTLDFEYHVYIWQVSPQLSCGDNCQIWMWFKEHDRYICKIENFAYREINEQSLGTPTPGRMKYWVFVVSYQCSAIAVMLKVKLWKQDYVTTRPC